MKVVILSGAGISKESGIDTFRDSAGDGLWNNHKIEDVATPKGWAKDPQKVNDFYNERRIVVLNAKPNDAHIRIADEEDNFDIQIITQNVDDLLIKYFYINLIEVFRCLIKNYFIHTKQLI